MKELRPCPFCGGRGKIINLIENKSRNLDFDVFVAGCMTEGCYCVLPCMNTSTKIARCYGQLKIERAVQSWNTRALNELDELKLSNVIKENIVYKAEGWEKLQKAIMSTFGVIHQAKVDELIKEYAEQDQPNHQGGDMKRPEKKEVMSYDNLDLNDCIKYVGDIEGAKGYNQAIEESDAYYEELLGGLKEKLDYIGKHSYTNSVGEKMIEESIMLINKELGWE